MSSQTSVTNETGLASQQQGIKREQSDDGEESTRRVSQRTDENQEDAVTRSMKQLVLEDLQSDDVKVIEKVLEQLRKAMRSGNEGIQEFFFLGGQSSVIAVMRKHQNCHAILMECFNVVTDATCMSEDLQNAFRKVGGIEAVLAAMEKFPNDRNIQFSGLLSLANLCCHNEANAKTLVTDLNGVSAILKSMHIFSNDEDVASAGCLALRNLCCHKVNLIKPIFFYADTFTALAKARDAFKENEKIHDNVTEAIRMYAVWHHDL